MTRLESGAIEPEARPGRSRRDRRRRACERAGNVLGAPPRRGRSRARPADAAARPGAVRAGAVQPARQRRRNTRRPAAASDLRARRDGEVVAIEVIDEGAGHSAGRSRAHLRQVLSRAGAGPAARRHRARPCDLPRLCRGAWAARSPPATAATARAPSSRSACRCRPKRRSRASRPRPHG